MKIVATDTYVTDFDNLSWDEIEPLGALERYPYTPPEKTVSRLSGTEIALVNKTLMADVVLQQLPDLRYIGVTATGVNNIDLNTAKTQGIAVTNVPGYSTRSVAQYVFAAILHNFSKIEEHSSSEFLEKWQAGPYFSLCHSTTRDLSSLTLGIIGLGAIGNEVKQIAETFGMTVLVGSLPGRAAPKERVPLEDLLPLVDALTLHCPLTEGTEGLIGESQLSRMKPSSILINAARGGIVDEYALAEALKQGSISGAYVDVLTCEPPSPDNPLLTAPRIRITPHIAWASRDSRMRLLTETAFNVRAFLGGENRNRIV